MSSQAATLWVALVITISVIIANILYQKISSYVEKNDFYLNTIDRDYIDKSLTGPSIKLGFLHMRKAGGTHIDMIINEFMLEHNCISDSEKVGVRGIKRGIPLDMLRKRNYTEPSRCPRVNYVHEETTCVDGMLLRDLPPRSERKDHFTLLTTLRDPIERIGSQAFYGSKSIGHHMIIDLLFSNPSEECSYYRNLPQREKSAINPTALVSQCRLPQTSPSKAKACLCVEETIAKAMQVVRVNETLWRNWMDASIGYVDEYMPNYFLRRLVRTTNTKPPKQSVGPFNERKLCLTNPEYCLDTEQYDILKSLFPTMGGCSTPKDKRYNVTVALEVAKSLLKNQFDFIITEYFGQSKTLNAIRSALHNSFDPPPSFMERRDNGGMHTTRQDISTMRKQLETANSLAKANSDVRTVINTTRNSAKKNQTLRMTENKNNIGHQGEKLKVSDKLHRRILVEESSKISEKPVVSYRNDIPPGIIRYLEKENAADIELYKFAVAVFEERSKIENW